MFKESLNSYRTPESESDKLTHFIYDEALKSLRQIKEGANEGKVLSILEQAINSYKVIPTDETFKKVKKLAESSFSQQGGVNSVAVEMNNLLEKLQNRKIHQ